MIRSAPVVAITLRGLLDRRRVWLMVLLAAAPVLLTLFAVALGDEVVDESIFDQLVVRSILPLLALVFGIELAGDSLFVRTSDYGVFTRRLPAVAHAAGVRLLELRPTDDSLESVFAYLVGR